MVQRLLLEEGHVEFIGHERAADVARQCRMAAHRRQLAGAATFVGDLILVAHAQRKGRIVVEEEGGHMVVVDHQQHIRLLFLEPLLYRFVGLEDGRPDLVVLLVGIEREADGGGM